MSAYCVVLFQVISMVSLMGCYGFLLGVIRVAVDVAIIVWMIARVFGSVFFCFFARVAYLWYF